VTTTNLSSTRSVDQIVQHLQRHGQATIRELEQAMGVSTTAVREHLIHLQGNGLVEASLVRRGPGRPYHVYSLTTKAQQLFPRNYDVLIDLLLREIAARDSAELDSLLERISEQLAEQYALKITGEELAKRLHELRATLVQQGIPAEVSPTSDGLSIFACPYYEVAREHVRICAMERQMIEQVLGEKLELQNSIREGHHSCHFAVKRESDT
jgi:Predicted transcriptional regulator